MTPLFTVETYPQADPRRIRCQTGTLGHGSLKHNTHPHLA